MRCPGNGFNERRISTAALPDADVGVSFDPDAGKVANEVARRRQYIGERNRMTLMADAHLAILPESGASRSVLARCRRLVRG